MLDGPRLVYNLAINIALPFLFLRLLLRSFKSPMYRQRCLERLGIFQISDFKQHGFWIHAVSVGEVVAAIPLIKALKNKYPNLSLTVTTTTVTGSQRVTQSLGDTVTHVYMPYDLSWAIKNFLQKIQPKCLIIMETELWPNVLHVCKQYEIPVIIANARISDKSLGGYLKIKHLIAKMLEQVSFVAAQSNLDGARFLELGLANNKLQITGNLKFEVELPSAQEQLGKNLKLKWIGRQVLVAASTHAGEEEQILNAFKVIQSQLPGCLLILVPRHPERFSVVAKILDQSDFKYQLRSTSTDIGPDCAVLLGDTMGELNIFYAAADLAFVGGSLLPIGGHNLLEPISLGVPTITGRYISNFQEIIDKLQQCDAVSIVENSQQLADVAIELLTHDSLRAKIINNGLSMIEQNRGAVTKILLVISNLLSE